MPDGPRTEGRAAQTGTRGPRTGPLDACPGPCGQFGPSLALVLVHVRHRAILSDARQQQDRKPPRPASRSGGGAPRLAASSASSPTAPGWGSAPGQWRLLDDRLTECILHRTSTQLGAMVPDRHRSWRFTYTRLQSMSAEVQGQRGITICPAMSGARHGTR